ncbi:MAG: hypothetical protein LDL41_13335 [Coleofasciculus sp. S288]|nr:hypothetical protein [Coleofasciculus sp. S288]
MTHFDTHPNEWGNLPFEYERISEVTEHKLGEFHLKILKSKNGSFISEDIGFSLSNFAVDLREPLGQRKRSFLKSRKFSGELKYCFVPSEIPPIVLARPVHDWFALWEYLASKGNHRALSLLRHLAERSPL